MGRAPCCDKKGLKKGPWAPEEDKLLVDFIQANGHGSWRLLPELAGLNRCGKSCRLRWTNYLRPDIKRGPFTAEEQKSIVQLHGIVGNRWSMIAAQLPGRTDNEIKNFWNTHLKKQLRLMGLDEPPPGPTTGCPAARHMAQWETARLEAEARLSLHSSSAATEVTATITTSGSSSSTVPDAGAGANPSDVFLRLWDSDIGSSFRKVTSPVSVKEEAVLPEEYESSTASDEKMDAAAECQMFLDLACEEFAGDELGLFDELGQFHGRYGGFSLFPPLDVLGEASLDTAF